MFKILIKRLLLTIPLLLVIALIIFFILELSPGDPMAQMPLTIPPEVKEKMRLALGLSSPWHVRFYKWLIQFFYVEPLVAIDSLFGLHFADGLQRIISWQSRAPVFDVIQERLPQTLSVVGSAFLLATVIAIPLGAIAGFRENSRLDRSLTVFCMLGLSIPSFFLGLVIMIVFAVELQWFPTVYNTLHRIDSFSSLIEQLRQMFMPVLCLGIQYLALISRYQRGSVVECNRMDFVRTARAKGMSERRVLFVHILKNALLPVITIVALTAPTIFGGAIITEQIFKVNGIGHLLIGAIDANDIPMVQTLAFIFAVLIVLFNLLADLLYSLIDPRVSYD